jgi:threonine/homoserine/homoserine lactone efflux protein
MLLLELAAKGAALGLANSLSPGPLQLLLVRDTLRSGRRSGLVVASSSFFADVPIVAGSCLLGRAVLSAPRAQAVLVGVGVLMLLRLAYQCAVSRPAGHEGAGEPEALKSSFRDGLLATLLNPHPWAFWLLVGVPWGLDAISSGFGIAYFAAFQVAFVGANCGLVLLAHALGSRLGFGWRPWTGRVAALLFLGMAVRLVVAI